MAAVLRSLRPPTLGSPAPRRVQGLAPTRRAASSTCAGGTGGGVGLTVGELLQAGEDIKALDCRSYAEYLEGHIPGSSHFDWEAFQEETGAAGAGAEAVLEEPSAFAVSMEGKGVGTETAVAVYDDGGAGGVAGEVLLALRLCGHPQARLLLGGWEAWEAGGGNSELYEPCPLKQWAEFEIGEPVGEEEAASLRAELGRPPSDAVGA